MNKIKKVFSINDLENLSGIKAHTIRIWEKRYSLLSPERTSTNIRTYDTDSLKKLLNIVLLYDHGYKISKIAKIPEKNILVIIRELVAEKSNTNYSINTFKLAMINYDQDLFQNTYNSLLNDLSFREIFWDIFIPLLDIIGMMWQTDTICPAQEHFISNLIKQKICDQTEKLQLLGPPIHDKIFVLFLPENEFHEIGLLFLNYEIIVKGYKTIYLGQSIPLDSLVQIQKHQDNLHYISYFTSSPSKEKLGKYLKDFTNKTDQSGSSNLWITGWQARNLVKDKLPKHVRTFESIQHLSLAI